MVVNYVVCYFYWAVSEWVIWIRLVLCWGQQLIDVEKNECENSTTKLMQIFIVLSMIFRFFIKAMYACSSHTEVCEIIPVNLQKLDAICYFFRSVVFPLPNSCDQLLICPIWKKCDELPMVQNAK